MRNIKIGIDCRLWNETGVGRYIRNLVWELAKIDKKNSYTLFFRKNEFENVKLPGENFGKSLADIRWHSFSEQINLYKIFDKAKLDFIHFPYFSVPFLIKTPFIVTIHDLIINHFPTGKASTKNPVFYHIKHFGYRFILQKAINNAKKIIAVSNATKNEIIKLYNTKPEKITVTYEGADEKILIKDQDKKIMQGQYFLYVGNAYPHKNLERLLKAFASFKNNDKRETKLVLVGKEDFFYKRLKKTVDPLFAKYVLFYEKVSDGGLASLYKHAKALVIPSFMEGFGLPAVEAMVNECIVLAADIPSLREVCKEVAFYFDPFSINAIANTLAKIAETPDSKLEIRKEQGLKLSKSYSWKNTAARTLEVYESCARL